MLNLKALTLLAHLASSLDLSVDLNDLSLPEMDRYLQEASSILEVYPESMTALNENLGRIPEKMSKNRSKRSYNVFAMENCGDIAHDKLNKCLRIYGVCGQYIEILRSKLITINLNNLQQKKEEQEKAEAESEFLSRSSNSGSPSNNNNNFAARQAAKRASAELKISTTTKMLERVMSKIEALQRKTEDVKNNMEASFLQRSANPNGNDFAGEDLLQAIGSDDQEPQLVEVYHNTAEAKRAHKVAKVMGTIPLGLDVHELVNQKNEHAVCSTIRLKVWTRFCEPCVEKVLEEGETLSSGSDSASGRIEFSSTSSNTAEENDQDNWSNSNKYLVEQLENMQMLPEPNDMESYTNGNELGLNFADI